MPEFAPVRVRCGRYQLGRLVRNRRRALALGLAVTAVALVAAGPHGAYPPPARANRGGGAHAQAQPSAGAPVGGGHTGKKVAAPVRIADAATVRLLRPGDRVDVIAVVAAEQTATGGEAHVVARGALVTQVPEPLDPVAEEAGVGAGDGGALVVLQVPRSTAARLAGASATASLAVTVW
ncbi:RcpC/CpaB family pilus assembly protein [Streptomyces sp. NPDC049687]|uniref:RcpC/CpaB family pilus assembly protein n=1 Tax=Streptomyces sp. NPDC049687 TaxID=3365596 RepID=UPI00378BE961